MNTTVFRVSSRPALLAVAVLVLVVVSGCRNGEDGYARKAADGAFDQMYGPAGERGGDAAGTVVVAGAAAVPRQADSLPLPEDFPEDVALPEHYLVESVLDLGSVSSVTLAVPDRLSTLFSATREDMRNAGWEQTISLQRSADYAVLGWRKDVRETSFTFVGTDSGTTLSVQLQKGGGLQ